MPRKVHTELTVQEWFTEINRGLEYRNRYGIEDSWPEIERMVYNVHDSSLKEGPNIMWSTMDSLLSTLNVPKPTMLVKPLRMESVDGARVVQSVDNMLIKAMRMQAEVERAICCSYMWHRGILKIGYDSEYGWAPEFDVGGQMERQGYTLTQFNRKGQRIEFGGTAPGMPWVEAVLPHDFVVPWGTKDIESAPWVAERVIRHIDDIKGDVKYDGGAVRDLDPIMSMEDFVESYQVGVKPYRVGQLEVMVRDGEGTRDAEYVEMWEIHDRRTGKIIVIATGHDEFLRNEVDGLQVNGLPYVSVNFVPNPRNFWSTSDAQYLKPSQAELTDIHIQAKKQRRLSNLRFLYQQGAISADELKKALSGDVGAAIMIKNGFSPQQAIQALQPGNNFALYQEGEAVRRDAREMVGMSRNQNGEYEATGRRTAREAMIVQDAAMQRMGRRQQRISDLYCDTFRKINPILFRYWTAPRIAQVTDQLGAMRWVQYTGQQLQGYYDLDTEFSSEPVMTLQARKQEALMMLQAFSGDPRFNPVALAQYVADAYNDVDFNRVLAPGMLNGGLQNAMLAQGMQQPGGPGASGMGMGPRQGGGSPAGQGRRILPA